MKHSMVFAVAAFCLVSQAFLAGCGPNTNQIRRMQALEEGVDSPTTAEELSDAIKKYQNRIEDILNADVRIGIWYKILGTRYLDNKMYGKALETFREAITYYPTNQNLYYYVGVCAGYMAKSALDFEAKGSRAERDNYLALSETAYLRALELEPNYARALYGLSVLYVFELNRPDRAIPHLERLVSIEKRNLDAMFILARASYVTGDYDRAVEMYDLVLATSKDAARKAEAQKNKETVLAEAYGGK